MNERLQVFPSPVHVTSLSRFTSSAFLLRYKSNVESITKVKSYQSLTMSIDEFLSRMVFFLPNKQEKSVSDYAISVRPVRKIKLESLASKYTRSILERPSFPDHFDTTSAPKNAKSCGLVSLSLIQIYVVFFAKI